VQGHSPQRRSAGDLRELETQTEAGLTLDCGWFLATGQRPAANDQEYSWHA
jgi:hypothetical protein